jgi:hypothetical protein
MGRLYTALFILSVTVGSGGCANYNFSNAVYDGVQTRDHLQSTPTERAGKPEPMNYQQYESERIRQK